MDSVVLDDAVATQDTITQLIATIRRVRRETPGAAEIIAAACHAHDYDDPGKSAIAWDDDQAREALVSALVDDATTIVHALTDAKLDERAAQALALLALIAGRDVEPARSCCSGSSPPPTNAAPWASVRTCPSNPGVDSYQTHHRGQPARPDRTARISVTRHPRPRDGGNAARWVGRSTDCEASRQPVVGSNC